MIVDTHLLISQILYKYLSKQMNFKLDRLAFAGGNIKPDFSNKEINRGHTAYQSLYTVNKYSKELMNQNISIKEFSRSLGVICHFACDYFCIYHRDGNDKKGVLEHLLYEVALHIKLLSILATGKVNLNNYEVDEINLEDVVLELQKKYYLEPKSLSRDITYALFATSQISKLIVFSSQLYPQQKETSVSKRSKLMKANVGS